MMRHNAILRTRIERLEARKLRPSMGRPVLFQMADRPDTDVVALTNDHGFNIARLPNEPFAEFTRRAFAIGPRHLFCVYDEPEPASELQGAQGWPSAPASA